MVNLLVRVIYLMEAFGSQRDMETYVIEVTDLNFEVRCDLQGHLEAVGGNMHIDTRVIKVADVKSEVI